jgi:hypothetical protein
MKMTKEHYAQLSQYLETGIIHVGTEAIKQHRAKKLGKVIENRFAWDLWNIAYRVNREALDFMTNELYKYLHDDHIETALKHFVKNYPAINI